MTVIPSGVSRRLFFAFAPANASAHAGRNLSSVDPRSSSSPRPILDSTPTTADKDGLFTGKRHGYGFDSQLDVAQALERAFKTRIESGAIKTDKTPQELVRLY